MSATTEVIYPPERSAKVPCGECGGTGERPDKPSPGTRWAMPECSSCHGTGERDRKHYAYCKRRECIGCLPTIEEIEQMPLLNVFAEMLTRCIPQSPETKTHEGAVAVIRLYDGWYHSTAYFARLHTFAERDAEALREALRRHVMDWGECDNLPSCGCSHATALHLLDALTPNAVQPPDEPAASVTFGAEAAD